VYAAERAYEHTDSDLSAEIDELASVLESEQLKERLTEKMTELRQAEQQHDEGAVSAVLKECQQLSEQIVARESMDKN
jgi:hypothetical protein